MAQGGKNRLSDDEKKEIEAKVEYYKLVAKCILVTLGLIIIFLLLPVVLALFGNIAQLTNGGNLFESTFEQSPFLKYQLWISMGLVVAQVLVVIALGAKIRKLRLR